MMSHILVDNMSEMTEAMRNTILATPFINFWPSVDTFFVIGGSLLAFTWLRHAEKDAGEVILAPMKLSCCSPESTSKMKTLTYWLQFYRHRIVRLLPAQLFAIFAYVCFWDLAANGRISALKMRIKGVAEQTWGPWSPSFQCKQYWWQNALFLNSILPNRCMPWTWSVHLFHLNMLLPAGTLAPSLSSTSSRPYSSCCSCIVPKSLISCVALQYASVAAYALRLCISTLTRPHK